MKFLSRSLQYFFLVIFSFYLGTLYKNNLENNEINNHSNINFELFNNVWDIIQEKYVNPEVFSEAEPFEFGIVKGLISGLDDPFSSFMTPDENNDFYNDLQGNFEGIGAELTIKNSLITIVSPLKGSPAKAAGLLPEDIIIKVNDEDIVGLSISDVVKKIRGEKGTSVVLNILHKDATEPVNISVVRDTITIASVESKMIEEIGFIEINQFGEKTVQDFEEQFVTIMKNNPIGIILDLRFNGGGYLDGAVEVASAFFANKTDVVKVKDQKGSFVHKSFYKPFSNVDIPLVLLINKGSASASEILAGAIQDHKRGIIVGETSFGKGTVQEVISLNKGASLRLTIAEWLTPNGRSINEKGITPDVFVEKTIKDFEEGKTPQLDKAIELLKKKVVSNNTSSPSFDKKDFSSIVALNPITFSDFENNLRCTKEKVRGCYSEKDVKNIMENANALKNKQFPSKDEWKYFLYNNKQAQGDFKNLLFSDYIKLEKINSIAYFDFGGCCVWSIKNATLKVFSVSDKKILSYSKNDFWDALSDEEIAELEKKATDKENDVLQQLIYNFQGKKTNGILSDEQQEKIINKLDTIKEEILSQASSLMTMNY